MPPNGLVIYTGTVMTDDGKEKKLNIDFEPFKPINTSLYLCDNKFHTEALNELLESDSKCASHHFTPHKPAKSSVQTQKYVQPLHWIVPIDKEHCHAMQLV